jgi:hypothetical protein
VISYVVLWLTFAPETLSWQALLPPYNPALWMVAKLQQSQLFIRPYLIGPCAHTIGNRIDGVPH